MRRAASRRIGAGIAPALSIVCDLTDTARRASLCYRRPVVHEDDARLPTAPTPSPRRCRRVAESRRPTIATREPRSALDAADPLAAAARRVRAARRRDLPRRQFARRAAARAPPRAWQQTIARRMGRRPDPQLERRRLDRPARSASATRSRALIGAAPGEVSVGDSTSVNLFKVLSAGVGAAAGATRRGARVILSERSNFPTDLYIAESVAASAGAASCALVDAERPRRRTSTTTSRC